ncbi:MAG: hypothetical protein DRQ40_09210 [Gammaproteobacteria bacterium]|nr:MAG: hypothetical protein DRQ40_09210 [Gammaproteobacteria bacterium]
MGRAKSKIVGADYRPTIQSLGRGLKLLDYVVSAGKPVELGELAMLLGIERSSAHRLMATLIVSGFIIQDSQKKYLAGPAILELATKVGSREQVHDIVGPYLDEITEKTGESSHLAVMGREQVVITSCVASKHILAVTGRVGASEPLYCTALGKAIACEMTDDELTQLFSNIKFEKFTPKTITTLTGFKKECLHVKEKWLAKDDEEFIPGIRCLASPVKNFSGKVVAAVGISGPASRLNNKEYEKAGKHIRETAIDLSKRLGYTFDSVAPD